MRGDQLAPDQHGAENHLQAIEEVVAHDDHGGATSCPALAGRDRLYAGRGHGQWWIETCNWIPEIYGLVGYHIKVAVVSVCQLLRMKLKVVGDSFFFWGSWGVFLGST